MNVWLLCLQLTMAVLVVSLVIAVCVGALLGAMQDDGSGTSSTRQRKPRSLLQAMGSLFFKSIEGMFGLLRVGVEIVIGRIFKIIKGLFV